MTARATPHQILELMYAGRGVAPRGAPAPSAVAAEFLKGPIRASSNRRAGRPNRSDLVECPRPHEFGAMVRAEVCPRRIDRSSLDGYQLPDRLPLVTELLCVSKHLS